jgi:hypothetical protein
MTRWWGLTALLWVVLAVQRLSSGGIAIAQDRVPATGGDLVITPLIHSSLQIEHAGKVIQIDPWSRAGLSRMKPADLIVITDDVAHHLDARAIAAVRKPGAPVVIAANGQKAEDRPRRDRDGQRRRP